MRFQYSLAHILQFLYQVCAEIPTNYLYIVILPQYAK